MTALQFSLARITITVHVNQFVEVQQEEGVLG